MLSRPFAGRDFYFGGRNPRGLEITNAEMTREVRYGRDEAEG